jgi:hypothetical protein
MRGMALTLTMAFALGIGAEVTDMHVSYALHIKER